MESFKKIGYILIALVYLFLSTGVALVKTNCLCSDTMDISIYDITDAENNFLSDQKCCETDHSSEENSKENPLSDCGCDIPIVTYLKLTNHHVSDTKLEYPAGKTIIINYPLSEILVTLEPVSTEIKVFPHYPPPEKPYGRILISFLNQRKIAHTA